MNRAAVTFVMLALAWSANVARAADDPEANLRATFDRFVEAQNAHDARAVEALLLDSPNFLWITKGTAVWGRAEAVKRFESLYQGTWHLEPRREELRVVLKRKKVAQIFVPIRFTMGPPGQPAQDTEFLMNQTLVHRKDGWKIASILPISVAAPAPKP